MNTLLFSLLIAQSIIHLQGVFAATNQMETERWNTSSSFIDSVFNGKNKRLVCAMVYGLTTALFFSLAFNVDLSYIPYENLLNVFVISIASSLIAIQLFPNGIGFYINKYFVIVLNLAIAIIYLIQTSALPISV